MSEISNVDAQRLDDTARGVMHQSTMARLQSVYGDQLPAKLAAARDFLTKLDRARPGVLQILEESGAGNSYAVCRQVIEHAERINAARRK